MFHRIVVPTDFSECAREAWSMAERLGAAPGSELILTHVLTQIPRFGEGFFIIESATKIEEAARRWAEAALEDWAAKARAEGLNARVALRSGVPHDEIVGLARDEGADLIVIGTQGRGGMNRAAAPRRARGAPVDLAALAGIITRFSQLLVDLPELGEIEINPLTVGRGGVVAVDARARLSE